MSDSNLLNYPLRFKAQLQYRLWGGDRLITSFHKAAEGSEIGESWEISAVPGHVSEVAEGPLAGKTLTQLMKEAPEDLLGKKVLEQFGSTFPLLIKFIDAKIPLSVQVHPNDALAQERHQSFGKNEMWYILEADPDAELIVGFNQPIDRQAYQKAMSDGRLEDILHREKVEAGDMIYIPTGTIHAIGAGILLAEIQQSSDVTYRVFDYNRVDASTGTTRELHTELALDAIDYSVEKPTTLAYDRTENRPNPVIETPYFTTQYISLKGELIRNFPPLESFKIYICVAGTVRLASGDQLLSFQAGECVLIPARLEQLRWEGEGELLEVSL